MGYDEGLNKYKQQTKTLTDGPSRASTGTYSDNIVQEKIQLPLLQYNLENYAGQILFMEELLNRLESIGHRLHDTNVPVQDKESLKPEGNIGRLFDMQDMNYKFRRQNERLEEVISKFNNLI